MAGKYAAHHEVRRNLGCILWIAFFGGIGSILSGLSHMPSMWAWVELVIGVDLLAVLVGIWYAKEWARWTAGIIAALYCLASLGNIVWGIVSAGQWSQLVGLVWVCLFGVIAWYAFRPETRRQFADAREMIARSRAPARPR